MGVDDRQRRAAKKHSLDRLLAQAATGHTGEQPAVLRLWLEAPYVLPKAMLVHVVATRTAAARSSPRR